MWLERRFNVRPASLPPPPAASRPIGTFVNLGNVSSTCQSPPRGPQIHGGCRMPGQVKRADSARRGNRATAGERCLASARGDARGGRQTKRTASAAEAHRVRGEEILPSTTSMNERSPLQFLPFLDGAARSCLSCQQNDDLNLTIKYCHRVNSAEVSKVFTLLK